MFKEKKTFREKQQRCFSYHVRSPNARTPQVDFIIIFTTVTSSFFEKKITVSPYRTVFKKKERKRKGSWQQLLS